MVVVVVGWEDASSVVMGFAAVLEEEGSAILERVDVWLSAESVDGGLSDCSRYGSTCGRFSLVNTRAG